MARTYLVRLRAAHEQARKVLLTKDYNAADLDESRTYPCIVTQDELDKLKETQWVIREPIRELVDTPTREDAEATVKSAKKTAGKRSGKSTDEDEPSDSPEKLQEAAEDENSDEGDQDPSDDENVAEEAPKGSTQRRRRRA